MKKLQKLQNPKIQVALSLAVAATSFLLPSNSQSSNNYCLPGVVGDCELMTDGAKRCVVGWVFDDCR